ncbi:putative RNA dependent RNA polymerase [Gremmeniella abietina RNA virus L1]|uniref:RNA-directed RNA polymerase n=3 Tax=Gremmeniella abietina RNA virus L1 TaxID=152217 RepID=Q99AT3_9VIRU|nr:putative RNA dependent RNA polymerase [Gremmeniella abietina RNA virus L1]
MIESPVSVRANEAGIVGQYLKGLLNMEWASGVMVLSFSQQISEVYKPTFNGLRPTDLQRAAAAYLVPDFPVQVRIERGSVLSLLSQVIDPPARVTDRCSFRWLCDPKASYAAFPPKQHPGAMNKVNVYLNEVASSLLSLDPAAYSSASQALWPHKGKIANDQASAIILYGYGLRAQAVPDAMHVAATLATTPDLAKALTNFLKATGANGSRLGALLCESNVLLGRAAGPADLSEEARYRTSSDVESHLAIFSDADLGAAIDAILDEEIKRVEGSQHIEFDSYQEHWNDRWAWAVNGAHSGHVSRLYPRVPKPPGMLREHRRAWLESVTEDPRTDWDGKTFVSASPKLEAGKTRAIFACDTVNYLAFEHLLAPVEKRWRNSKVILDPGRGGHLGMIFRTTAARARAGVSMMLDYDDFNSHHSTRAMQMLFQRLGDRVGYPADKLAKLVASFEKMYIYNGMEQVGRVKGTLMSGHRGTTFINSVLNKAYLLIVLGEDLFERSVALHVGDDVYFGVRTYAEAGEVVTRIKNSPLRMNRMKQSVGHVSTEFLRNATSGRSTYGYFARAVASTVSGNWVNEMALSPSEALSSIIGAARTLVNRSGAVNLPLLLHPSLVRMTGLPREDHKKLRELLLGTTALDNGPQYSLGGYYTSVSSLITTTASDRHGYTPLPREATTAYLSCAADPLEVNVLTQAGVSVVSAMEEASFRKSLPARYTGYETLRLGPKSLIRSIGTASVVDLISASPPRGVLERYPLLTLAKRRLPEYLVRWAVSIAGGNPSAPDIGMEAWGEFKHGCMIATPMSYSDAATFGKRTVSTVLTCPLDAHV